MAMYHFRLKSDKKPNGTKISAVQHLKYINREEKFSSQEQWEQKNKFVGNFITTAETKDLLDGQNALLYKTDDFGSIKEILTMVSKSLKTLLRPLLPLLFCFLMRQ